MRLNPPAPHGAGTPVTNLAGGPGFVPDDPRALLVRLCACCFLGEDQFYASGASTAQAIRDTAARCAPAFVLKLAAWCRSALKLRTVSQYLLALGARQCAAGDAGAADRRLLRAVVPLVCQRADEPGEVLAAWSRLFGSVAAPQGAAGTQARSILKGGRPAAQRARLPLVPRALLKGLSDAIGRFSEYQLAKYRGEGRQWSLRNVFRFVRPVPADAERSALYGRVVRGELATPETWEVAVSNKGASRESWDQIAPKMGLMALVRNLRNFAKHGATGALTRAVEALHDPAVVLRSKMLPFRFLTALRECGGDPLRPAAVPLPAAVPAAVHDALRDAVELSIASLPRWPGRTAVAVDVSGSMRAPIAGRSTVTRTEIACLFGALAARFCDVGDVETHGGTALVEVGVFADRYQPVALSRRDSVLTNAQRIAATPAGGGTEAWRVIRSLRERKRWVDRLVVLSDEQSYAVPASPVQHWLPARPRLAMTPSGLLVLSLEPQVESAGSTSFAQEWTAYRREVNPNATLVCVNLASYGTAHATGEGVLQLSGWSEQILGLVPLFERGDALVAEVEGALALPGAAALPSALAAAEPDEADESPV